MINKKQIIEICSPISQADKDSSKFVEIYEFLFKNQDFLAKNKLNNEKQKEEINKTESKKIESKQKR